MPKKKPPRSRAKKAKPRAKAPSAAIEVRSRRMATDGVFQGYHSSIFADGVYAGAIFTNPDGSVKENAVTRGDVAKAAELAAVDDAVTRETAHEDWIAGRPERIKATEKRAREEARKGGE